MKRLIGALLNKIIILKNKRRISIGQRTVLDARKITFKSDCTVSIGNDSNIHAHVIFDREKASVKIGDRTFIGNSLLVAASGIEIGNDVLVSWGCTIVDHNSHSLNWEERKNDVLQWNKRQKDWSHVKTNQISISDKVWIGLNAIILKGVHIGEGAVIGAGSVVTKDVPAYTLYAGNPATFIRSIAPDGRDQQA